MPREQLWIDPRFVAAHGLRSANDFFELDGPIISGHPDRHVRRVTIGDETYYLKREHRVPYRERLSSFLAGFGFVSVSIREARALDALATAGIAAPECVAVGETADGRAFLLLQDVGDRPDLRRFLRGSPHDRRSRRGVARRLAVQVARIHNQGFTYPDLYAKHVLVEHAGERFAFLDWQRSRRMRLTWRDRCRDLAALNASLADQLADADDRLTFLLAYWKAAGDMGVPFRSVCTRIQRRTAKLLRRSSIREQRLPAVADSQPLHWFDGERLCLSDLGREVLGAQQVEGMAYRDGMGTTDRQVAISDTTVRLQFRRTHRPLRGLWDRLRGRRWQAPECRQAAQLLREERLGAPRRLLAFGQWQRSPGCVDSFLMQTVDSAAEPAAC